VDHLASEGALNKTVVTVKSIYKKQVEMDSNKAAGSVWLDWTVCGWIVCAKKKNSFSYFKNKIVVFLISCALKENICWMRATGPDFLN